MSNRPITFARGLERERDKMRKLYNLNTQCLRAKRDELQKTLAKRTRERDGLMARLTCERERVEILRAEIAALKDALRASIDFNMNKACTECNHYFQHAETCRHYATERKVMEGNIINSDNARNQGQTPQGETNE